MIKKFFSIFLFFFCIPYSSYAIDMNFVDAPIYDVISVVADYTGMNFIYNGDEKRITWRDIGLNKKDCLSRLKDILNSNNLIMTYRNNCYLISSISNNDLSSSFFMYHPVYLNSEDLIKSLSDIWGESKKIKVSGGKNFIVCFGISRYVNEFLDSLLKYDSIIQKDFHSLKLNNVPVSGFVKMLEKYPDLSRYCCPDFWNNSLIVRGNNEVFLLFKSLVSLYDVSNGSVINEVFFLNKVNADSVIPIVNSSFPSLKVHKILDNKILLSGSFENVKKAKDLLFNVDGQNYQIKVDCIIASLSDETFKELGLRLGISNDDSYAKVNDSLRTFFDPMLLLSLVRDNLNLDVAASDDLFKGEILSQPELTVLNGETAQIFVGQNMPIVKSNSKKKNKNDLQNVELERVDIGIKLVVTPIIQGDFVRLSIYQEISGYNNELKGIDISTDKKMIETTVLAADGQTIILGGVKSAENIKVNNGIPLLSSIPLLGGSIFSYKSSKGVNRNLVISLRPRIIRPII